jgi:hypothetical protein
VIRRQLPGFVEHMLRINHWPDHVRATFRTTTDIEDDMYDETGLPPCAKPNSYACLPAV